MQYVYSYNIFYVDKAHKTGMVMTRCMMVTWFLSIRRMSFLVECGIAKVMKMKKKTTTYRFIWKCN